MLRRDLDRHALPPDRPRDPAIHVTVPMTLAILIASTPLPRSGLLEQIFTTHNMAAGNAGAILGTDILLPVIGFALLYAQWKVSPLTESVSQHPQTANVLDVTDKN